jgi:predicted ATPase
MSIIKAISIKNFRSIKELNWNPNPGLNCLIGSGDSGKSTVLDAIDFTLGARRTYSFTDADFFQMNTQQPIDIKITIGALADELKNIELYGMFLRGFDNNTSTISDEAQTPHEHVLTMRLTVHEDLEPDWTLYSDRADSENYERRLSWKHRELLTPAKLGATSSHHLSWAKRSILNKLSEDTLDVSSMLAGLSRQTRETFSQNSVAGVDNVLHKVQEIANSLGVPIRDVEASLDVNGISITNGAISVHNYDKTPLRQLGTGSSRLLISGLQKAAGRSKILIVDEAEYGLEPYRITRLLNELGSKDQQPSQQVFITTHSPYVLRELQSHQLCVLRKLILPPPPTEIRLSHWIYKLGSSDDEQSTLRACAEAFFSKAVIVGEGSTEVGLVKGIDLYLQDIGNQGVQGQGAFCTDGSGGDKYFMRAEVFNSLGYPTAILKDSDITDTAHLIRSQSCRDKGISIFEWGHGLSTEGAIFSWCPLNVIPLLLNIAVSLNGEQKVHQHILNKSNQQFSFEFCVASPQESMRIMLASAASDYKWFKNISKAEEVTRKIIGPYGTQFNSNFNRVLNELIAWVRQHGEVR